MGSGRRRGRRRRVVELIGDWIVAGEGAGQGRRSCRILAAGT